MLTKSNRGFTLIECVIVLLILGIIAAISVPTYVDMENGAKDRVALENLSAIRSKLALDYARSALEIGEPTYPTLNAIQAEPYTPTASIIYSNGEPISNFTDTGGYIFNSKTGEIRVNVVGKHSI